MSPQLRPRAGGVETLEIGSVGTRNGVIVPAWPDAHSIHDAENNGTWPTHMQHGAYGRFLSMNSQSPVMAL